MKKLEVINFLRGFAIFTIVLMHGVQGYLDGVMHKVVSLGGAGVHVFILCSGFGLYLSYMNKPLGYTDFLRKRFGKVYFPYIIVIGLYAVGGSYHLEQRIGRPWQVMSFYIRCLTMSWTSVFAIHSGLYRPSSNSISFSL